MGPNATFSGYRRQRKTRFSVRLGEVGSRLLITLGGIGTIIAIVLVCVFLVWVTVPLFFTASSEPKSVAEKLPAEAVLLSGMDSEQHLGWSLFQSGKLTSYRLDTGEVVSSEQAVEGQITAVTPPSRGERIALGFANGTIRLGKIAVVSQLLADKNIPAELQNQQSLLKEGKLYLKQANGTVSALQVQLKLEAPEDISPGKAIRAIDLTTRTSGPMLCTISDDQKLRISEVTEIKSKITQKVTRELESGEMLLPHPERGLPAWTLLNGVGDNVFLVWKTGDLVRINTSKIENLKLVEEVKLTEAGATITAVQFMIGKTTLLVGDSSGHVRAWFRTRPEGFKQGDNTRMEMAHDLPVGKSAVSSLAVSFRSRLIAAGYDDGSIQVVNVTNELKLLDLAMPAGKPQQLAFAPKEDGLIAYDGPAMAAWSLQVGHHEATFRALVTPIWYESYPGPAHVWQSTSGDDAFEPKFGLWPLIFGTLKATFYSLLIGVPLALCAAIYTREFLHPKVRSVVKPTIEVMASLPSVVLGFLGALVIAPFVESVISIVIAGLILVPLSYALAGFLWHTIPQKWQRVLSGQRIIFIVLLLPLAVYVTILVSPIIDQALFGSSFKNWLRGRDHGASGWFIILIPLTAIVAVMVMSNFVNPRIRHMSRRMSTSRESFLNLLKFLLGLGFTLGLAWLVAQALVMFGLDPRNSIFGKYDQKNALVVGLMMGFAIIPIIYTLAEDALSSVPDHLRSASLGCGATTWQTASRIVLPTALGGIFSAVMVGLGRAVGETMIVLMAAGNVPVLEMNLFNGFRTLSANIAVELPEAVQNSTHYRILFLSALTLFLFTFVLNTLAESMRQRFRKRAFEL